MTAGGHQSLDPSYFFFVNSCEKRIRMVSEKKGPRVTSVFRETFGVGVGRGGFETAAGVFCAFALGSFSF